MFDQKSVKQFEECSKTIKYRLSHRSASHSILGKAAAINKSKKTIYGPLYITLPSIGHGRRGTI
jgi:hypothetical protein